MSLSPHHQNQLHLIQAGLLRSDPQLAARLSIFGRLCAGQAMPAQEQVSSGHDRIRQAAARATAATRARTARGHLPVPQGGPRPGRRRRAGGRARPPAQRRERARPRPGNGRPAGPGGRG